MAVAVVGLVVNLAQRLAAGARRAEHGSAHMRTAHDARPRPWARARPCARHHGHDHNFRAAYLHVLADAFTSVLAIAALAGGLWFGWRWLDPAVALLGAR